MLSHLQIITLLNKEVQVIFQLFHTATILQELFSLPKGFQTTRIPTKENKQAGSALIPLFYIYVKAK